MKIKDIDFGKIDANNELQEMGSEKYQESFFDYDKYHIDYFVEGKRYYVCGNKGTGKTALLKYLEVVFKSKPENLVLAIRFKSDIDDLDRKEIRTGGIKKDEASTVDIENARFVDSYAGIWQVYLIHKMLEAEKRGEYKIFEETRELTVLRKLVNSIYKNSKSSIIPRIKRGKIGIDVSAFKKISAELSVDLEFDESKGQVDFMRTYKAINDLYGKLRWCRTPVYILIDELELSVKSSKARKQDIELVRDLILSVDRLNEISKKHNYQVHFIASIREEVISDILVAGTEINKSIEDFGVTINWSYKGGDYKDSPLLKIIERKIHASEKMNGAPHSEDIWSTYFVPVINEEECRKYILSYSWQKPRDIVRMLRIAQEQAGDNDEKFTQEMFDRALQEYSEKTWGEICEELILHYSREELDLIKKLFIGISIPFTYHDIQERANQLSIIDPRVAKMFTTNSHQMMDFLHMMYKWGIIGNTGQRMMFSFLGYKDLDITGKMVIHKPLRNFFGVTGNR